VSVDNNEEILKYFIDGAVAAFLRAGYSQFPTFRVFEVGGHILLYLS